MHGGVLDVGCGEMPLRGLLPPGTNYTGLDIPQADGFGMRRHLEIEDFDGLHGTLLATVPFSARVHHAPHDYYRFTRFGIARMFGSCGSVEVSERGDDLTVIANKLLVVCVRIARPPWPLGWRAPPATRIRTSSRI